MADVGDRSIAAREMAGMPLVKNVLGGGPGIHSEVLGDRLEGARCGRRLLASNLAHRSERQGEQFVHRDHIRIY